MNLKWPEPMSEGGRLTNHEADDAWVTGYCHVAGSVMSCQRSLHISLFFDGTNNNDDEDNPRWRDSNTWCHTNVARLYKAAIFEPNDGIYKYYIAGVGTPFEKIGEGTYSQDGKALAKGFNQRCVWAYTRVLNSVYGAILEDSRWELIPDDDAKQLSNIGAFCDKTTFDLHFDDRLKILQVAHANAKTENTIKKIWINAIGFSRGAAAARAFVNKLVNEWAPSGMLGKPEHGPTLPYQVNFMGLFDTVASVGLPDSFRTALNLDLLDGHAHFASDDGLAIPDWVRSCVHAFSIHEQRMSFPLDSIRQGGGYTGGEVRREIAYPGVHSDVGGGYGPGDQGKGCDESGNGMDERKLSQIALHDMYIAALRYGVPMMKASDILAIDYLAEDFKLHADTIAAFNAWLKTTSPISSVEEAMSFGMSQMLSWRALRAQFTKGSYVTNQGFYKRAREDRLTPRKMTQAVEKAKPNDARLRELNAKRNKALAKLWHAKTSRPYPQHIPAIDAAQKELDAVDLEIRSRLEEIYAEIAYADVAQDKRPRSGRPGEGEGDITANDKTDLLQGAEEMRLLLAHLHPEQRTDLSVDVSDATVIPPSHDGDAQPKRILSVRHAPPLDDASDVDSPRMSLVDVGAIKFHATRTSLMQTYNVADDVLPKPVAEVESFLKKHTSMHALSSLPQAAVKLFDDYVHDSRCWFRVPYFHEYAPGGYGWPRVVFVGKERLSWLGQDPLAVALREFDGAEAAIA
ncbi:DUF2235 domain-containing protein [Burkholderia multivorans]|uniref:T6SS phospholipase effector Tle1-like catalytic domain-containing protein n=1 Tax=Burkholderia multivorans TaxID=87883 RepID=UPI000311FE41|nr:DUF2235 domain-containing protein [Burkholderia multivorans]AJY15706.1 hypothetical protein NP80_4692 [Burkholderia multivorans ATCC BAA-247]AVR18879.1 DUF2235 domain-containing protein [Burkholderia multivorans]MCO1438337.1 DUF2235 domain-containing protein [Burkholderia multivorans]UQN57290.1 DUF2235 domain-containing protein [Burkholderia multivorans]UQN64295.1 DUF2235 domain-containing protein [Burkholderia multivorans]